MNPPDKSRAGRRRWVWVVTAIALVLLPINIGLVWWMLSREASTPDARVAAQAATTKPAKPAPTAEPGEPGKPASATLAEFADQTTRTWQTVPRGTQLCDGVTFICDGAIRTAGMGSGRRYPGAVPDVPVHSRGSRIHLLQASENSGGAIDGAPYGRMILHYANGESRRFDLLYAVHGRDWMGSANKERPAMLDPNTTLGWSELHPRNGMMIRFYHTTFTNPLPDIDILSADFISPLHSANLLLFGLTVDNDARPLAAPWQSDEVLSAVPPAENIIVTFQDSAGRPLTGATFAWSAIAARGQINFAGLTADSQGRVPLEFPQGALQGIRYVASAAAGGMPIRGEILPDQTGRFATNAVIKLGP